MEMASNSYSFSWLGLKTATVLPVSHCTFLVLVNAGTGYPSHMSTYVVPYVLVALAKQTCRKKSFQSAMSGLWYLLYLRERSRENMITKRLLMVSLHPNVHAVFNQHWQECGICDTGVFKTWSISLNKHPERKLLTSSVRNEAPGLFNGTIR